MAEDNPICIFGPGGDYKKEYTPDTEAKKDGLIMKAFSSVADSLITRVADSEKEEKGENLHQKKTFADTKKSKNAKVHKTVSRGKPLSTDDQGTGRTPRKKHNNRVRTLRKPTKKRFSVVNEPEGSLFGSD